MQRDIRTTLAAGDFITRKASRSAGNLAETVDDIQRYFKYILAQTFAAFDLLWLHFRPLSDLPARMKDIVSRSDSWDFLSQGIDPTEKSSLIGGLSATTTKQRAEKVKKKKVFPNYFRNMTILIINSYSSGFAKRGKSWRSRLAVSIRPRTAQQAAVRLPASRGAARARRDWLRFSFCHKNCFHLLYNKNQSLPQRPA